MKITGLLPYAALASAMAPISAHAQGSGSDDLRLVCTGSGYATEKENVSTQMNGGKNEFISATTSKDVKVPIQGTIQFVYAFDGPKVRLFPGIMPSFNTDGAGKWRKVKDFVMDSRNIKGNVGIGFLTVDLYFDIDRRTGEIQASNDTRQFSGTCVKDDPNAKARF